MNGNLVGQVTSTTEFGNFLTMMNMTVKSSEANIFEGSCQGRGDLSPYGWNFINGFYTLLAIGGEW